MKRKGPPPRPLGERFWAKVERRGPDECWLWIGARLPSGYGTIWANEKQAKEYSHRVSWVLIHGPIPAGQFVCHTCDTPPCCNPRHLFIAPPSGNSADMVLKGRTHRGEMNTSAKLRDSDIAEIRTLSGTVSQRAIARRFGVRQQTISKIVNRHLWAHIQGATA